MKLPFDTRHARTSLFFLPALLLAVTIGEEIDWGARLRLPLPQAQTRTAGAALAVLPAEFGLPPLEQGYASMTAQPLFVPTRRAAPTLQTGAKSSMQKGQFLLEGVILTKEVNLALLREIATNKAVRLEQGKEFKGIRLEKLDSRSAVLQQGDDSEELTLKIPLRPRQAATPANIFGAPAQPAPPNPGQAPGPAPVQAAGVQPPAQPGAAPGGFNMQAEIARRRALRGLPP